MGNGNSRYNEHDVPKKVIKWKAELEHVRELNKMLSEERRIISTNMEQELYDIQLKLFYMGKSATRHIGFRGYLKIINKVTPRTQADFMASTSYDPNKKVPNQTSAMVLRSAILNFSLFSLFEAWLLKRMHFVSIQKHQRRLHQKGWKNIVAFYSEEIPMIQEVFAKQEPGLQEKVEEGKKQNMDLLEEYEAKIFQQEEEILALRRKMGKAGIIDNSGRHVNNGDSKLDETFPDEDPQGAKARGFGGFRSRVMTPVQVMIQKRERASIKNMSRQDKAWRADNNRTWGAPDSEDESLYMDDEILHTDQVIKFGTNDKIDPSDRHEIPDDNLMWSDKVNQQKGPEIVYTDVKSDMSAITVPNTGTRSDESTSDSFDNSTVMVSPKDEIPKPALDKSLEKLPKPALDESLGKFPDATPDLPSPTNMSVGSDAKGSLGNVAKKQARDKDAIREERERLEKAKAERHRRANMERQERESFYKQERERLKHQEKRLTMKREESTRMRQDRPRSSDIYNIDMKILEHSDHHFSTDEDLEENLKDEPLDGLREVAREYETTDDERLSNSKSNFEDDDNSDVLQERPGSRRNLMSDDNDDDYMIETVFDDKEEEEGLDDLDIGGGANHHPSMDGDALMEEQKEEKTDRRKMWQVDKAESDRGISCDNGDSIENELKRLNEFETVINTSDDEEIAASNISNDFKMLRSTSGRNLVEQGEHASNNLVEQGEQGRSRSRPRTRARSRSRARALSSGRTSSSRTRARSGSRARALSSGRTPSSKRESDARQNLKIMDLDETGHSEILDQADVQSIGSKGSKSRGRRTAKDSNSKLFDESNRSKGIDSSNRSKRSKSKGRGKLKDHFLDNSMQSDDVSAFSKKSAGTSKGKKKKKKTVEARRKLEAASYDEDAEVVAVKKKKKRKKKKQLDEESYSSDDDKSVTSALTTNSYE